eukprot:GILK01007330.1.p1 GENE.GILK01007330.1~~GILK01007330.1.p1  ORF type:complete len:629 (+),score=103.54 GILK01007330.1:60-1946(+)
MITSSVLRVLWPSARQFNGAARFGSPLFSHQRPNLVASAVLSQLRFTGSVADVPPPLQPPVKYSHQKSVSKPVAPRISRTSAFKQALRQPATDREKILRALDALPSAQDMPVEAVARTVYEVSAQIYNHETKRLARQHPKIKALFASLVGNVSQLNEIQQTSLIWSFANLQHDDRELFEEIVETIKAKFRECEPRTIAQFIWACATVGYRDQEVFMMLRERLFADLNNFNSKDLANIIWAFAKSDFSDEEVFDLLIREMTAVAEAGQLNAQQLVNVMCAVGPTTFASGKKFAEDMVPYIWRSLSQHSPLSLSNLLWALSRRSVYNEALFSEAAPLIVNQLNKFPPQPLAMTLWAYAAAQHYDMQLLLKASQRLVPMLVRCDQQQLSMFCHAYATFFIPDRALLNAMIPSIILHKAEFDLRGLVCVLWSFTVLDMDARLLFFSLTPLLIDFWKSSNCVAEKDKLQLFQVYLALKLSNKLDHMPLPDSIIADCEETWYRMIPNSATHSFSRFEQTVRQCLDNLQERYQAEYMDVYTIDFALPDEKIAIEVHGHLHYMANAHKLNGSTRLKHRLLKALGWKVVDIAFFELESFDSVASQQAYIAKLLQTARNTPLPDIPEERAYTLGRPSA